MINLYTLISYLVLLLFTNNIFCFELDISKIVSYSISSTNVTVWKARESENLYTHNLAPPILLKNIYNGNKKLYFDQLVTTNQLLLSSSILWVRKKPLVIQLNLEKSSVLLLNESDSSLSVEAIFSDKTISNITHRIHSETEVSVDVDLSKIEDYDINNSKVYVTKLKLSDNTFNRYTLRSYNFQLTKLGKVLYKLEELKTVSKDESGQNVESILTFPDKDKVYSIRAYSYEDFPILIEILYTFNRRQFYGYTPEKKWHHLYFPAFQDPTFPDFLYNKLNYYACKNGFKYTIEVNQKTDRSDYTYRIDNYCIGSDGVETIVNDLKLTFYIDEKYKNGIYRCFEHVAENKTQFFLDHLMAGTSVLHLPNVPNIIKCVRVYKHLDLNPFLIVFVDNSEVLHYYKYKDNVWKAEKKVSNVKFDEKFSDDIRTVLDRTLYAIQVTDGSVIILTDSKTSYNKTNISEVIKDALSSDDLFDNNIPVTDKTGENGTCLSNKGYKVYMHNLESAEKISSELSESFKFYLLLYINNTKINLYETGVNDQPTRLTYQKPNHLYVYFYREYPKLLLLCHDGKSYRPYDLGEYNKKWVQVQEINHCYCQNPEKHSNNQTLSDVLLNVLALYNLVNPYEQNRDKNEYENSTLFFEYIHKGANSKKGHSIEVCKKLDCSKSLKLTSGESPNFPLDRAFVYYNRYDTKHENPLFILLRFNSSAPSRYYEPSKVHGEVTEDSSKPIGELEKCENDSEFVNILLEKNDTFYDTVTYHIDQKDNSYNSKRVTVSDETDKEPKLKENGFKIYVHTPTSSYTNKKSFILHKFNILKNWEETKKKIEPIDQIQNVVYNKVIVYFSDNLDIPLLAAFLKTDGNYQYCYFGKNVDLTFWRLLDAYYYQDILQEGFVRTKKMSDELAKEDNSRLIRMLKKIELMVLNTVILVLDKKATYNKDDVNTGLSTAVSKPKNVKRISESQPDTIAVTEIKFQKLNSYDFNCYKHSITPKGSTDNVDMRIMVPADEQKLTNVILFKPETPAPLRSKLEFDLTQRENNTYYDATKFYVYISMRKFGNNDYVRYTHHCFSCGQLSDATFALKLNGISVNFTCDLPESEHKRLDFYVQKDYTDKFVVAAFRLRGANTLRYLGYADFIQYFKDNKHINLSSLPEHHYDQEYDDLDESIKKILDHENWRSKKYIDVNSEDLFYEKGQTDLYVYFYNDFPKPLLLCYNNKAFIPRDGHKYEKEWVHVNSIKGCKCEGTDEKTILDTLSYVYSILNLHTLLKNKYLLPSIITDINTTKQMPLMVNILTVRNTSFSISTLNNDTNREAHGSPTLKTHVLDLYYYTHAYEYTNYEGDLEGKLNVFTKPDAAINVVRFYGASVMSFTDGTLVHRIEYFYDYWTHDVTLNLYTNTLFMYTFKRNYYHYYDPFVFVKITKVKLFESEEGLGTYYEKIKELNRRNFYISYVFKPY